jgi:NAD-dependent DNA ligase
MKSNKNNKPIISQIIDSQLNNSQPINSQPINSQFISSQSNITYAIHLEMVKVFNEAFNNKNVVFSSDVIIKTAFENAGAKISDTVDKNTDFLIVYSNKELELKTGMNPKVSKALELGIKILTTEDLREMVAESYMANE